MLTAYYLNDIHLPPTEKDLSAITLAFRGEGEISANFLFLVLNAFFVFV